MTKRLSEIAGEPVLGQYYFVPCVRTEWGVMPILGPWHNDKEYLGVEKAHYHYDPRFVSDGFLDLHVRSFPACSNEQSLMASVMFDPEGKVKPFECRRKCTRRMPDFPSQLREGKPAAWLMPMQKAYTQLTACGKCPHRGFPLSAENADENGNVVCPGHGLQFNLKTGRVVDRL